MPDTSLYTTQLRGWVEQMHTGDLGALEECRLTSWPG